MSNLAIGETVHLNGKEYTVVKGGTNCSVCPLRDGLCHRHSLDCLTSHLEVNPKKPETSETETVIRTLPVVNATPNAKSCPRLIVHSQYIPDAELLLVFCDDGTIWGKSPVAKVSEWKQYQSVPDRIKTPIPFA